MVNEVVTPLEIPRGKGRAECVYVPEEGVKLRVDLNQMVRSNCCLLVRVDVSEMGDEKPLEKRMQTFVVAGRKNGSKLELQLLDGDKDNVHSGDEGAQIGYGSLSAGDHFQFGKGALSYVEDRRVTRFLDQSNRLNRVGASITFSVDAANRLTVGTAGREAMIAIMPTDLLHFLGVTSLTRNFNIPTE